MELGMVGLGKMGINMVFRLLEGGHSRLNGLPESQAQSPLRRPAPARGGGAGDCSRPQSVSL